ncbi:SDR family NAD(P)-dependent oxidoreductase [Georgenia sp. Z1344]|uniref:SDR family NAD(P)-dependent oxidoreductase n=1 Tax=Georgenia sp. Z1344 TaxID=3416706 RepID=UPI003CF4FD88
MSTPISAPTTPDSPRALVTGASSGIGRATAVHLARAGYRVVATARRADRLAALAEEIGCDTFVADLTVQADVDALAAHVIAGGPLTSLVNNAGGAVGADRVEDGDPADWARMYDLNVLTTLRVTRALLPHLRADGGGDVLVVTSTAATGTYPGGAGYTGAKHAARMIVDTLRLELMGEPIRVLDIQPGMVATPEFSVNRYRGDAAAAAKVYEGVAEPLTADDVADVITFALTRPAHVNLDSIVIRPRAQATHTLVHREL